MGDLKISAIATQVDALAGGDKFPIADVSNVGVNTYATATQIATFVGALSNVNVQEFTVAGAGTYTPTAGMKKCLVFCTGGGGSSGDCTNTDAVTGGGGGGGTAIRLYTAAEIGASKGYVVGAGGTRGAPGGNGVDSTFSTAGTLITGGGGIGSAQGTGGLVWVQSGGAGGTASGGDLNVQGNAGGLGMIATTTQGFGGNGGGSFWGGGATAAAIDTAGVAGGNYGGGAAGAHASSATDRLGANGGTGVIFVIEFI